MIHTNAFDTSRLLVYTTMPLESFKDSASVELIGGAAVELVQDSQSVELLGGAAVELF